MTKTYGNQHTLVQAVVDVSLTAAAGEVVLIVGPSGSGKTTLLSMLGTLLQPTHGTISINGKRVSELEGAELAKLRLQEIGFIFQQFHLLSALTAQENVMVPLLAAGWSSKKAAAESKRLLERFGLGRRLTHVPEDLSGGEQQRVAIARALANQPSLILADEPTANLDSKTGHEVAQLLRDIAKDDKKAVLIVSHDPRIEDIADRVVKLEDGRIHK